MQTPAVEVEFVDGTRFVRQRIAPEPGFGMITIHVLAERGDDAPEAMIVPLGTIRRIELRKVAEERVGVGFSLPLA